MRLLQLVYIFSFSDTTPVTGLKYSSWVDWEARCQRCTALTRKGEGIFCTNFGVPVIGLPIFHWAWYAIFYQKITFTSFLVYQGSNSDHLPSSNEYQLYLKFRPCDSIYWPFECDECSFYRLTGYPSQHDNHIHKKFTWLYMARQFGFLLVLYTRNIVSPHLHVSEKVATGQNMGFRMFPTSPGPFPTYYYGVMRAAIGVLTRSNIPGKH